MEHITQFLRGGLQTALVSPISIGVNINPPVLENQYCKLIQPQKIEFRHSCGFPARLQRSPVTISAKLPDRTVALPCAMLEKKL